MSVTDPRLSLDSSMDETRVRVRVRLRLLDLPAEIHSQIASYLPLSQILPFLSLHPLLLSLTQTHLSPLPTLISHALDRGPPYSPTLAVLPSLTLYQPDDGGRMWVDTLVRARAKWILERMEMGRWRDTMWKEAFERRFLPSWKRYKGEGDSWRAVFIRVLGRLEHRHLGCTHEESWTRFVTLHRNGAASINRIYSRLFDPYDIYEELKHQNNFASAATHVRVVLHLSDVRILAIGVLHDQPSLFVNPNAHLLLHPPLLRRLSRPPTRSVPQITDSRYSASATAPIAITSRGPAAATSPSHNTNEIYYPLVRSMSPSGPLSTSYGLSEGSLATSPPEGRSSHPPQSSRRTTLSSLLPSLGRRTSATADPGDDAMTGMSGTSATTGTSGTSPVGRFGAMLTQVRSRDSDDGGQSRSRRWSLGRSRTSSAVAIPSYAGEGTSVGQGRSSSIAPPEISTPSMPTLPELPLSPEQHRAPQAQLVPASHRPPTPPKTPTPSPPPRVPAYPILRKPQPALSHARYPNYTESKSGGHDLPSKSDLRGSHIEVEDDGLGAIWSSGEAKWGDDGTRMAEWDPAEERIKRWVGPMILVAQLHPCDRADPHPPGSSPDGEIEGDNPDLGPKGMYVSLGFEDLDAIAPWVELRGGGPNNADARRTGLGFE